MDYLKLAQKQKQKQNPPAHLELLRGSHVMFPNLWLMGVF